MSQSRVAFTGPNGSAAARPLGNSAGAIGWPWRACGFLGSRLLAGLGVFKMPLPYNYSALSWAVWGSFHCGWAPG